MKVKTPECRVIRRTGESLISKVYSSISEFGTSSDSKEFEIRGSYRPTSSPTKPTRLDASKTWAATSSFLGWMQAITIDASGRFQNSGRLFGVLFQIMCLH